MPPARFTDACCVLWPPGYSLSDDVKHAAALLLFNSPNFTLPAGGLGSRITEMIGTSVKQLLPLSLIQVLTQDPSFSKVMHEDKTGWRIPHVRLDVILMRATVHSAAAPLPVPPPLWQEDRSLFYPTDLPRYEPAAADPWVLGAGAGAGAGPCRSAPPLQATPFRYFTQLQREDQARQTMTTHGLQLQQQGDGSYAVDVAQPSSTSQIKQDACSNSAGMLTAVQLQSVLGSSSSSLCDVNSLLELLPLDAGLLAALAPYTAPGCQPYLVDLAADLGRNIQLRLSDKSCVELPMGLDLDAALQRLEQACCSTSGSRTMALDSSSSSSGRRAPFFSDTNRLGVPGSLHRISAMRDRAGAVFGLTYMVSRHVPGVADLLADVLSTMSAAARGLDSTSTSRASSPSFAAQPSKSLLLLGRPGVGKTTLLRDVARLMSLPVSRGGLGMSVVIVDTSNEIAGDSDQPHPCIGNARRMMVPQRNQQAAVMIEAVMNHTPEVVIVDEIATREEAAACRTIAQRGVLLVSTSHGNSLGDLLRNPDLQGLVWGVKAVTLGDRLAADSNGGHKTRLERAGGVTFGSVVEILDTNRWRLHPDVACSVDALLAHSSSSSSSTDLEVPPHTAPGVDTQLRSRVQSSQGSKLLVSFESGRVPRTAVWAGVGIPPWTAAAQLDRPAPALFQRPPVAAAQFQGSAAAQHQVPPVGSKRGWGHGEFDAPAGLQQHQQQGQQHQQQQQSRKKMKTGHIGGPLHKKMSPPKKKQAPKKKNKQYYYCQ